MDGLREYRTKRTFDRMAEPAGNDLHEKQGIFVVAKHGATHYPDDFRLEIKDIPASGAVPKGPSMNFKDRRLAVRVEDHPLEYPRFPVGSRMGTRKLGQWSFGIEVFFLSGGADQRSC